MVAAASAAGLLWVWLAAGMVGDAEAARAEAEELRRLQARERRASAVRRQGPRRSTRLTSARRGKAGAGAAADQGRA